MQWIIRARCEDCIRWNGQPFDAGGSDWNQCQRKRTGKASGSGSYHLNKNTIPNDPRSPFVTSGVRLGTPAVTSRGMKEQEMDQIAEMIAMVIRDEKNVEQVKEMVQKLTEKYPLC